MASCTCNAAIGNGATAPRPAGRPDVAARLRARGQVPMFSRQVRLGAGLSLACSLIVVSSAWFLDPHTSFGRVILIQLGAVALTMLAAALRPKVTEASKWLLTFPAIVVGAVVLESRVSITTGSAYTGFFIIGFIFVGLTQRRWTSCFLVPLAVPAWYLCQIGPSSVLRVRLPITVAIWLLVAELLATRAGTVRLEMGELIDAAHTDALTGLGNRRGLDAALSALAPGSNVVLLDLDHFKHVNDSFGHEAGDRMIVEFADAARAVLRVGDRAFRYGGEELVVIMAGGDGSPSGAMSLLRRLQSEWRAPQRPTFSGGATVHRSGSPMATLNRADEALYHAKRAGRNCWHIIEDESATVDDVASQIAHARSQRPTLQSI